MLPLVPKLLFLFNLILMIPAFPAASYLEDGLVINSMVATWSLVMLLNKVVISAPERKFVFPSTIMVMPALLFSLICSVCLSMVTPGAFSNNSKTLLPAAVTLLSTFNTVLSALRSTNGFCVTMLTSFNCLLVLCIFTAGNCKLLPSKVSFGEV
ncbi:hypothetical protein D3C87_1119600 [compost metagenome]